MKRIYLLLLTVCFAVMVNAQSSANYTFVTGTSASFTDMSSGTTQMVGASIDDAAGANTAIGFDFWLMGNRYTQFNATSNGFVGLSSTGTTVTSTTYSIAGGTATTPMIAACGGDLVTGPAGKVHYKVIGSAPNRVLVVEFLNMSIVYNGTTNDGTSQVRLYESTGVIECVYGNMNRNSQSGLAGNADQLGIGFSTAAANNFLVSIVSATNTATLTTPFTQQLYPLSTPIANLNTPVDGSRRIYSLTPPVPNAPTSLSFTSVGPSTMTLNWVDNSSNETGFAIYRSTDGVNYTFITKTAADALSSVQGGLSPSTTYFWRVIAVSEGGLSTILSGSQATNPAGNIVSTGAGGLWNTPATWVGGVVPTGGDNVTIADGATVTIDLPAAVCLSLTVGQGTSGILEYQVTPAASLTAGADVTIAAGGTFRSAATGTVTTHLLSLPGNLTNNGTLDFSTNANTAGANLTFTGGANSAMTGTGATTDLFVLTLSKTARAQEVELNLSNFSVRGLSVAATGALLTSAVGTGTLKLSGSNTFSGTLWSAAGYTIPATMGFWLNNANFTVNGQNGSPTMAGLLRITSGTFNIGTGTGNSMGFSSGSVIIVEGGAVNATGRFGVATSTNTITYTQTGTPVITVCTVGNASTTLASFDLGTAAASTISMTGGTIICQLANTSGTPFDYRMQAGALFPVGGTLQLGNAASGAAKTFNFRGLLPANTVITNTSAAHSLQIPATAPTTLVYGVQNLTINPGCTFTNLQTGVNPEFFVGSVVNNGTFTSTAAGSRVYNVGNGAATTWSGTGTFTAAMASFEVDNTLGVTLSTTNQIPTLRVIVFSGTFINCNKITLGNGGATSGTVQIGNTTTPSNAGVFDFAPVFNLGTGGQIMIYLRTTLSRTTGLEINPTRALTSLLYDDNDVSHSLTVAGGNLSTGTLALTNGKVITDAADVLTVTGTTVGSVTRTTGYVSGPLERTLPASLVSGSTYLWPVGKAVYTPFELVNPTTNAGGTVVLRGEEFDGPTGGTPGTGMSTINSDVYWNASITSGAGNFIGTTIRLTDAGIGAANAIGKSATQTGAYDFIGGNSVGTPVNTITSDPFATFSYFVMGVKIPPTCTVPTAVTVTGITTTTANVNFTCALCTGTYIVEYGTPGFVPGTGGAAGGGTIVTGAASPIPLSGLTPNTTYEVYVRQDCGLGSYSSNSTVVSFTTLCTNLTLPVNEGFNTSGTAVFPTCWTQQFVVGAFNLTFQASSSNPTTVPFEGTRYVYWNSFNIAAGNETRLVSRGITTTGTASVDVNFQWKNDNNSSYNAGAYLLEGVQVQYSLDGTTWIDAGAFIPRHDGSLTVGTSAWKLKSVTLPGAAGNQPTIYVGFKFHSSFGDNCSLDAVNIDATPACPAPTAVNVTGITTTSANVNFTSGGTSFIVEYGPPGFVPGTGAGAGGGTIVTGPASPIALSGLTGSTVYDVYVRQICTGPIYSANSGVVTFSTLIVNDDAPGAIALTVGGGCTSSPYTNLGSTQTAGEPFAACRGTAGFHTVWYSFVAPASGAVKISNDINGGTMGADSRMALFSTTNVNDYTVFVPVACDDDNGATVSLRSIIYVTGLTPTNTYYLQVDGFSSSTTMGTFCLTVDELTSAMLSTATACASGQGLSVVNDNYPGWLSLTDASGNLIQNIRGTTGGATTSSYANNININSGPVRSAGGIYYLDRNTRITNPTATNVQIQFFFLTSELTALTAVDPLATLATLAANRQTEAIAGCYANFSPANGTTTQLAQSANGTTGDGLAQWIRVLTPGFSNFYLGGSNIVLPTGLLNFSGYKDGSRNQLRWITSSEQNNSGFEVQRSTDGINYSTIGFVNSQALGGNSTVQLNYAFTDNSVIGSRQYYRLRQVDFAGGSKLSNIVLIKGDKPVTLMIDGLFPNPASTLVNVMIGAPAKDKITLVVTDIAGRVVAQKIVNVETGSNTIPVDITTLANGTYMVKLVCSSNCEMAVGKFVKQ